MVHLPVHGPIKCMILQSDMDVFIIYLLGMLSKCLKVFNVHSFFLTWGRQVRGIYYNATVPRPEMPETCCNQTQSVSSPTAPDLLEQELEVPR